MGHCIFGLLLLFNIIFGLYAQCEDPEVAGPNGNCYWDEEKDGADWYTASSVCAFVVGDNSVPKVTNAFVNSFLVKLASDLGTTEPFWLSAAVDYSGKWKWFDSTNLTFTNWAPGEPKNSQLGYCALFDPQSGKWRSENCSATHKSGKTICEQFSKGLSHYDKLCPDSKPDDNINYDYSIILNKCLYVQPASVWGSWELFGNACQDSGEIKDAKHLSIHDDITNQWVYGNAQLNEPIFLSIHDPNGDGTFQWMDGSKVDYTKWVSPPPAGSCGLMYANSSSWYPTPCDFGFGSQDGTYICQAPPK
uniref:C-type lectin domain-containing protein n=1 Tax=Acrobeloides nanus TaxID=290746 RepID=A0A914EFV5_9BILA